MEVDMPGELNEVSEVPEVPISEVSENLVSIEMPSGESIFIDQSEIKTILGKRLLSVNKKLYVLNIREGSNAFYAIEQKM